MKENNSENNKRKQKPIFQSFYGKQREKLDNNDNVNLNVNINNDNDNGEDKN